MKDALTQLFENEAISEQVRQEIQEAWDQKLKENKRAVAAELREEFAKKYEYDKSIMAEAINEMITDRLHSEIEEFRDDRKQLAEQKAQYAIKLREHQNLLKNFVVKQLTNEVAELHRDQKKIAESFSKVEEFVVESLAEEITDFHKDKKDIIETKVKLVSEGKKLIESTKKKFIKQSAILIAETVEKALKTEISQLKEDIEISRKNDFGRKIFESFALEYAGSYLNEKSEIAKLTKLLRKREKQLSEAKVQSAKSVKLAEKHKRDKETLKESIERQKTLNQLISPLSKSQKEIMTDLLESVQTSKLATAFEKYLPAVIDGKTPAKTKATLTEGKEITGNRDTKTHKLQSNDNNVIEICRLAGLN